MKPRESYPPGVPCWIQTAQPDPDAAARFYAGLFGWEFEDVAQDGAPGPYLIGRLDGQDVAAISSPPTPPPGAPPSPSWTTYVRVDSADAAAEAAKQAGGSVVAEPFDVPEAGRMAVLADTEGAVFS